MQTVNIMKTELDLGEEICTKCEGSGEIVVEVPTINPTCGTPKKNKVTFVCNVCNGKGKIDWIEKITGVKQL